MQRIVKGGMWVGDIVFGEKAIVGYPCSSEYEERGTGNQPPPTDHALRHRFLSSDAKLDQWEEVDCQYLALRTRWSRDSQRWLFHRIQCRRPTCRPSRCAAYAWLLRRIHLAGHRVLPDRITTAE